jgi:predicted amidohydrolase
VLANWPTPRVEHWVTLLKARAIENQAYVIGVNRIGADPNLDFPGRSLIIDPKGEIIADAGNEETILSTEIDLAFVKQCRAEFPAQDDRHPPENLALNQLVSQ